MSDEKSKKGEPLSFSELWNFGFMPNALDAVADSGLDVSLAMKVASDKTPGRITACKQNWNVISNDTWVLNVVNNGYSLSFKDGPPKTPFIGRNPPSDKEARTIFDR